MTRIHIIRCHGALDFLGDLIEIVLHWPLLRRLTRIRKRLAHSRKFS